MIYDRHTGLYSVTPIDPTREDVLAQASRWRLMGLHTIFPGSYRLKGIGRHEGPGRGRPRHMVEWDAIVLYRSMRGGIWCPRWTRDNLGARHASTGAKEGFSSAREARVNLLQRVLDVPRALRLCVLHEDCRADALNAHGGDLAATCAERDLTRMLFWEIDEATAVQARSKRRRAR